MKIDVGQCYRLRNTGTDCDPITMVVATGGSEYRLIDLLTGFYWARLTTLEDITKFLEEQNAVEVKIQVRGE